MEEKTEKWKLSIMDKMNIVLNDMFIDLEKRGVTVLEDDKYHNFVFSTDTNNVKISYHSLYRFSGMSIITHDPGDNKDVVITQVTDDMWLQRIIKPSIYKALDII